MRKYRLKEGFVQAIKITEENLAELHKVAEIKFIHFPKEVREISKPPYCKRICIITLKNGSTYKGCTGDFFVRYTNSISSIVPEESFEGVFTRI